MSIAQVAQKAGVSKATVSRILNGSQGASEQTARRVLQAAESLGYQLPPPSRRPGRKRPPSGIPGVTGTVAFAFMDMGTNQTANPFYSRLILAIESQLSRSGMHLLVVQVNFNQPLPGSLSPQKVDGILAVGRTPPPAIARQLNRLPTVWIGSRTGSVNNWADVVAPDNDAVGHLAGRYLLAQGLTEVAFFNIRPWHSAFRVRGEAFCSHVEDAGAAARMFTLDSPEDMDWWEPERFHRYTCELLDQVMQQQTLPRGIFVPADDALASLHAVLLARGIRPQQDVMLIGCNADYSQMLHPRPATIDLGRAALAEEAVSRLKRRLENDTLVPGTRICVPPILLRGEFDADLAAFPEN